MSKIFTILDLCRANLVQIEVLLRDGGGEERQPPPRKIVLSDKRVVPCGTRALQNELPLQKLSVWTGQEPGERIANTILLCAIRDNARQVTLEPGAKGVNVRFQIASGVREQKLPAFALAPIVRHFKMLANDERNEADRAEAPDADELKVSGTLRVAVDEQFYHVQFSTLPTQWGAGVKVVLSLHS